MLNALKWRSLPSAHHIFNPNDGHGRIRARHAPAWPFHQAHGAEGCQRLSQALQGVLLPVLQGV